MPSCSFSLHVYALFFLASASCATTLSECVDSALKYNLSYQRVQLEDKKAKLAIPTAWSALTPQLSTTITRSKLHPFDDAANTSSTLTHYRTHTLSQPLYNQKALFYTQQARAATHMSSDAVVLAKGQLIFDITKLYLQASLIQLQLGALNSERQLLEAQLSNMQENITYGLTTPSQLLPIRAQLESISALTLQTENQYHTALRHLNAETGIDIQHLSSIQHPLPAHFFRTELKDWQHQLNTQNAALKQAKIAVDIEKYSKKIVLADLIPTVSAFVRFQNAQYSPNTPPMQMNKRDRTLGLSLSSNLSAVTGMQALSAHTAIAISQKRFRETHLALETGLEAAYRHLADSRAQIGADQKALESAKEASRVARLLETEGRMSTTDVLVSITNVRKALVGLFTSRHEQFLSLIELHFLSGTLNTKLIASFETVFEPIDSNKHHIESRI